MPIGTSRRKPAVQPASSATFDDRQLARLAIGLPACSAFLRGVLRRPTFFGGSTLYVGEAR
jgi:hypothetical protein